LTVVILKAAKHLANRISRKKAEALEKEQNTKGLIKYKKPRRIPEQAELWKRKDFEREQKATGLVKYKEKHISQEEKFARKQREKYGPKAVEWYRRAKRKSIWYPYTQRKKRKYKDGAVTPTPANRYKEERDF